jgi:hypothetical protein
MGVADHFVSVDCRARRHGRNSTRNAGEAPPFGLSSLRLLSSLRYGGRIVQAVPAQAVLALGRHRQPRVFFGAPACFRLRTGKGRSASGTDHLARRNLSGKICHQR